MTKLIDHTRTPIGARSCARGLARRCGTSESIELRLGAVDELASSATLREGLARRSERGRGPGAARRRARPRAASNARELVALRRSLEAIPAVQEALAACSALAVRSLAAEITDAPELAAELARALVEDPPAVARAGGAMRPGYDEELDGIAEASRSAREWIAGLEASERSRTGIRSLKVGFNKVFGYYIEVSNANSTALPPDYIRKQTLTGAERYLTPELKEKEAVVLTAQERIVAREVEILRAARRQGRGISGQAPRRRPGDRRGRRAAEPCHRGDRAGLAAARGQRGAAAQHQRRPPSAGREQPAGRGFRRQRPRAGSGQRADHDPDRAEHGRQVDLPAPGRGDRAAGAVRQLRAGRARGGRPRRPDLHARRRARRHHRGHVDLHGRDDRDRVHPQPRDARVAGDPGRGGEGDLDLRRRVDRPVGGRAPARLAAARLPHAVRDALSRADGPLGNAASGPQPSGRGAR